MHKNHNSALYIFGVITSIEVFLLPVGGPHGRVGKVAEFQRSSSFDHLTAVTGVGLIPALATCETSHVLLAGVSGGFPRVLPFRPTFRLARLDMSEIILKETLN